MSVFDVLQDYNSSLPNCLPRTRLHSLAADGWVRSTRVCLVSIYIYIGIVRLRALRGLSVQIRTRTLLWFGHGCCGNRMQLEHGRDCGLGMDAVGMVT